MSAGSVVLATIQEVFDNFPGSILITDPEKVVIYASPGCLRITGYTAGEMLGTVPELFSASELSGVLASGLPWRGRFISRRKDGETYVEEVNVVPIRDPGGQTIYYLVLGEELPGGLPRPQRTGFLPAVDRLTGLHNRDSFLRILADTLAGAGRVGHETVVFHIDIDDFGGINDSFGVAGADRILAAIATRIKETLRQNDELARVGNDEFAIVLAPQEQIGDGSIREIAERLLESIRRPVSQKNRLITVTASIGVASFPADSRSADELFNQTIAATAQARSGGGNAFACFDTSAAASQSLRRELVSDLHQAIENGELAVHYQPQVSLASGAIVGMEALIRWQHPFRGNIQPTEFVPFVEHSDVVVDIGNWVLDMVCRQIRAWIDGGLSPVKVAVNLAPRHFVRPGLASDVAGILARHAVEPRLVEIEITEGAMMNDAAAAIRNTEQLKALGVSISLDDFGTGYSSLAYLSRFPIDVVKIDQSFVHDITTNPANAAIAQAMIAMSHKLGKTVLAEGVETLEQMRYLRRSECDGMQGFFFSKALSAHDASRMLRDNHGLELGKLLGTGPRHTVLLVDDEANILSALQRTLRREGYEILTAPSGAEGLSLLATHDVQVVVSDQRMPEMNGTEFLSRVKQLYPQTVRMVLSGYSDATAVTDAINRGAVYRFLMKPWDEKALKDEISGAFRHWRELYSQADGAGGMPVE